MPRLGSAFVVVVFVKLGLSTEMLRLRDAKAFVKAFDSFLFIPVSQFLFLPIVEPATSLPRSMSAICSLSRAILLVDSL